MDHCIYAPLKDELTTNITSSFSVPHGGTAAAAVASMLTHCRGDSEGSTDVSKALDRHLGGGRAIHVDGFGGVMCAEMKKHRGSGKLVRLSRKQLKMMGLFDVNEGEISYADLLPLHQLWKEYVEGVLSFGRDEAHTDRRKQTERTQFSSKLALCDFHGAFLSVEKSLCPSTVGICGIVIRETENTFTLMMPPSSTGQTDAKVNEKPKFKTILKSVSVFGVKVGDFKFSLFGKHLCHRTAQRSKMKFKSRETIQLGKK